MKTKTGNLTIRETALALQKSECFVRMGLQQGRLPFGFAVKTGKYNWNYYISRKKLNEFLDEPIEEAE